MWLTMKTKNSYDMWGGALLFLVGSDDFASVADRTGTYTAYDYASIMDHLIKRWKIADLDGLSGEAAEAQEYLMKQPARIRRLADFAAAKAKKKEAQEEAFSWIFGRKVSI